MSRNPAALTGALFCLHSQCRALPAFSVQPRRLHHVFHHELRHRTAADVAVADEKYFNHLNFPFCNALKRRNLRCFGRVLLHYIFHTAFFSTILDYIFLLNFWKIRLFIKIHFLFIQYSREYIKVLEMQVQNFYIFDSFRLMQTKIQLQLSL